MCDALVKADKEITFEGENGYSLKTLLLLLYLASVVCVMYKFWYNNLCAKMIHPLRNSSKLIYLNHRKKGGHG